MTVLRTCRQRQLDGVALLTAALHSPGRASPALLLP